MIWYTCKQCGKIQGRPETAVGSVVFCTCGQGNTVPWESTVAEPPPVVAETLPVVPKLEPVKFDAELIPEPSGKKRRLPRERPRTRDPKMCLNHQDLPLHETCVDCGEGFCEDCLVYVQGKALCGPCKNFRIRVLHQPMPTSQLALVSLLLALFTGPLAFCLFPMGLNFGTQKLSLLALVPQLTAVILGILALRRTENDPQLGGQALALSGILTGGFSAFWTVFLTLYATRLWA
jgi:hypothetical protein